VAAAGLQCARHDAPHVDDDDEPADDGDDRHGGPGVNISILASGAGGMYCGSCMRDNALATALKRLGHGITLIPLFTPSAPSRRT
jgi:hypothetical protein